MRLNVGIENIEFGTNILDIEVPEPLRNRAKVGIDWFDEACGKGIVPSSVMMLTGGPGAGKTTMLLQLADAITSAGHVCLYNTGEESLYQVAMVVERLKLTNGFFVGQDTMCSELLDKASALVEVNKGKQVFILQDSLQTLDDGKYSNGTTGATPLRCAEMLTDWAKSTYGIVVFIGQVNKHGEFAGKNGILHAIDVRAKLAIDNDRRSPTFGERIFEVTKNRFGSAGGAYVLGLDSSGLYEKGELRSLVNG